MGGKEKNKGKKQSTSTTQETHNPNLWPDLPQQLLHLIARKSSLIQSIFSKGVTKSWRKDPIKCSSSRSNPTSPWLELFNSNHGNSHNQPHTFNISFRSGSYSYWSPQYTPSIQGYQFLGFSQGLLMAKRSSTSDSDSNSEYRVWDPIVDGSWLIPSWDERIPFLCFALSAFPMIDNRKNKSIIMVLTGITHPAFAFYRIWEGGDWVRKDSTIVDPNDRGHLLRFTNGIWFKEKFYALSLQGTLAIIEENDDSDFRITALGKKIIVPSVSSMHFRECLIESEGKILLVFLISRNSIKIVDCVEVYELDADKLGWIKKESLEERTLFVGSNCCMSVVGNKVGCRGNCVYFSRSGDGWWVYEMETGSISPADKFPICVEPTLME